MPCQVPGSLTNDEVYAVIARILFLSGVIAENAKIDADTLPKVKMPNRAKITWQYQPE